MTTEEFVLEKETDEKIGLNSLLTDEDIRNMNLLKMHNTIIDYKKIGTELKENRIRLVSDDEINKYLDEVVSEYSVQDIRGLTMSQISKILTYEGTPIEFEIDLPPEGKITFMKDFLVFIKESKESMEKMDSELSKLEEEIAESQEEFDKALREFNDMSSVIINRIKSLAENEEDVEQKKKYGDMLIAFDSSLNLTNVIEFAKSYKGLDTLTKYRDNIKAKKMHEKCKYNCRQLGSSVDLSTFVNIETKFLPKEYGIRQNMFIFTVMDMIASWKKDDLTTLNGLFLTQFIVNIKNLIHDNFNSEEEKSTFINAIVSVLNVRY